MRPSGLVALLAATATASYLSRVNVSVAGALMMKELSLDQVAMGRVFSAFLLGYALCQVPAGMLADRFGAKRVLALAALPALAVALAWLAVRRMPPEVGPASDGAGVAADPAAATRSSAAPAASAASARGSRGSRLGSRPFVLLTASYTLQGYVGYIFVFWFYLYLVEVRHFDLLKGALLSSLPWLLSIVSIPLGGAVSDLLVRRLGETWGRRIVPMAGLIGGSLFISVGARTADGVVAAVCLGLATALVLAVEGPFWATMTELAPGRAGAAGGVMNMGSNLGGLVSPALTPVLAASIGWENALHVAAALSVVGGLLWLGISPGKEPA